MPEIILPPGVVPTDHPASPHYYRGAQGREFIPAGSRCWASIPVLQFLRGKPWDSLALRFVSGLRPSFIRVTNGWVTTDAHPWRVTVGLDETGDKIRDITQEMEFDGPGNGHQLTMEYHRQYGCLPGQEGTK